MSNKIKRVFATIIFSLLPFWYYQKKLKHKFLLILLQYNLAGFYMLKGTSSLAMVIIKLKLERLNLIRNLTKLNLQSYKILMMGRLLSSQLKRL